jgi:hypothetical protein
MKWLPALLCGAHQMPRRLLADGDFVGCDSGCRLPVERDVIRCVNLENNPSSFGLQWRAFRKTQLGSVTGTSISRTGLLGGSLEPVASRLVLDHYAPGGREPRSRRVLRRGLLRLRPPAWLAVVRDLVAGLWPLHRALFRASTRIRGFGRLYSVLLRGSPVLDYHPSYPELSASLLRAWATLDTHDAVTDRYRHLHTAEQVAAILAACGMERIDMAYAGNGVEARARRPANGQGR